MAEADPRIPRVRFLRRVDTRLDGQGRSIALRKGRLSTGEPVWRIEATRDGVTEAMNLSEEAMQALAAAHGVLATDTLAPIPLPDGGAIEFDVVVLT